MNDGYLSAHSAAAYLDLTYRAFDQAVRRHGIPHKRIGRLRRFLKADLDRTLDAMAQRPRPRRKTVAA